MDNLKFGVVLGGIVGLIACFLPLGFHQGSLFAGRADVPVQTYMVLAAYAVGFVVPMIAVVKPPMLRWQALTAASAFLFVLIKLRGEIFPFVRDGSVGAKLLIVAPALGLLFSILCLLKPQMSTAADD